LAAKTTTVIEVAILARAGLVECRVVDPERRCGIRALTALVLVACTLEAAISASYDDEG
jgi:hypothetical protein